MSIFKWISYLGYWITTATGLTLGFIYSFATRIMPYHLQGMGKTWEQLSPGTQWVCLNYVRSVGAGFLSSSTALMFLLIFPFRKGEKWAYPVIYLIILLELGLVALRTWSTKVNTAAEPPLTGLLILLGISTLSFASSIIIITTGKQSI